MKLNSKSHTFHVDLAIKYGIEEALLIHHIAYWIGNYIEQNKNFHEGKYWMSQSLDEMASYFPYLTRDKIFNTLERLCNGKPRHNKKGDLEFEPVLIKGNFNESKYIRTVWYTLTDKFIDILFQDDIDIAKYSDSESIEIINEYS